MEVNIETAVRLCPLQQYTTDTICAHPNPTNNTIQLANAQLYPVNYALPINCCQNTAYTTTAAPLVNYLVEGCDVSIVTMGQSRTGKTYTLLGPGFHCAASEAEHGIIPRFVRDVFSKMKQYRDRNWTIHVTWSQICGESVQDLLGGGSIECGDISTVFQLIQLGMSNLHGNEKSTHTLFTVTLEQQWVVETVVQHRVSTASFADLCGCDKSMVWDSNNGTMQTVPSDFGLLSLQRCIMTLTDHNFNSFNPYNHSVLTTLLKDSFGGRAKTLVICCISPMLLDFTETLYTLQLAMRVQTIKNYVTVNSYTSYKSNDNNNTSDVFGLQFAANQLFKLVTNAEELFQRLVANGMVTKGEQEQISQWLMLKQECEDCLSEGSEPHRSLERIEEEDMENSSASEEDEDDDNNFNARLDLLMDNFRTSTDKLISRTISPSVSSCNNSTKASSQYHNRGARGRRGSIHSVTELTTPPSLTPVSQPQKSSDQPLSLDSKKKILKQINTALQGWEEQICDLEQTVKLRQKLIDRIVKHKDTRSSAHNKIEQKCVQLRKELKMAQEKELKDEVRSLQEKIQDAEQIKVLTEDENKLRELETSLQTSKKQLDLLKRRKAQKEGEKHKLEKEIRGEEKVKSSCKSDGSSSSKIVALIHKSLYNEESLRHEARHLRKTREYLYELRCKITTGNKFLEEEDKERKILRYEEGIEAIDSVLEFKNNLMCGHSPATEAIDEQSDRMMLEGLLKFNDNEMRHLLHHFFDKVIELRFAGKQLEIKIGDIENQHEKLSYKVQSLSHTLQHVRFEAERRIVSLQQQHEDKLNLMLRHLARGGEGDRGLSRIVGTNRSTMTVQVAGAARKVDNKSLIARIARYAGRQESQGNMEVQAVSPAVPQAKVTRQNKKLFIQQTDGKE